MISEDKIMMETLYWWGIPTLLDIKTIQIQKIVTLHWWVYLIALEMEQQKEISI